MKIKIAHESPISIFPAVQAATDYDYCLVHLYRQNPQYKQLFDDAVKKGRHVLLDNSIFELKKSFDPTLYSESITQLCPTEYIIPDVLENTDGTIQQCEDWNKMYRGKHCQKTIGVVQGKTWQDLVRCYNYMVKHVDKIAISFDYSYYLTLGSGPTKWHQYATGRQAFIQKLINEDLWDMSKPVHLLGCAVPQEFGYYTTHGIFNIETLDTSNPVVHGILGIDYTPGVGLQDKNKMLLADLVDHQVTDLELNGVLMNIEKFQQLTNK